MRALNAGAARDDLKAEEPKRTADAILNCVCGVGEERVVGDGGSGRKLTENDDLVCQGCKTARLATGVRTDRSVGRSKI